LTRAAAPNARTPIEHLVRESGTKDQIAHAIVVQLTNLGYKLQKDYANVPGGADHIKRLLTMEWEKLREHGIVMNPLLDIKGQKYSLIFSIPSLTDPGLDIHQDTPTEILHTILLGIVKYFWGQTVFVIVKNKQLDVLQARLHSLSSDGLNIPRILADYMCQYRGSLIGKHFKTIMQILPHVVHDLISTDLLHVWLVLGRLGVLLWHTEIENVDVYLVRGIVIF
jgi:hypothetical protein